MLTGQVLKTFLCTNDFVTRRALLENFYQSLAGLCGAKRVTDMLCNTTALSTNPRCDPNRFIHVSSQDALPSFRQGRA